MRPIQREWRFLLAIWQANLLAAMEYRVAFLSQVIGMMLNNGIYFIFWILFFDRFQAVRGWALNDMLLLFGVVAAVTLFGWQLKKANSVTSAASSAPQGSGPRLMFEETSFDVGKVPLDKTVERAYVYRNVGTQPVVLTEKPTIDVVEGC